MFDSLLLDMTLYCHRFAQRIGSSAHALLMPAAVNNIAHMQKKVNVSFLFPVENEQHIVFDVGF